MGYGVVVWKKFKYRSCVNWQVILSTDTAERGSYRRTGDEVLVGKC